MLSGADYSRKGASCVQEAKKKCLIHRVRLVLRFRASLGQMFDGMWKDVF